MSDDVKPEVLPGDLITGPGLYEARNGDIVRIVEHDGAWWVCECDGKRDWYHNDGTRRFKSTDSDRWKLVRWIGPPPAEEPTTSEQIAEIESQAADYTPPEGWRVLQAGEVLEGEDWLIDPRNGKRRPTLRLGHKVEHQIYIRRIEPEPEQTITSDDVAAEAINEWPSVQILRRQLQTTEAALLEQQQRNEQLVTQGSQQRMQIQELRSEVSHVQGLLGETSRRVAELETMVIDLRNINATTEKSVEAAYRHNADLQHRLDTVAAEWAQQAEATRRLQIELDAREQVPQAVSKRWEESYNKGAAQAVETIAEWTAPFRTCGSQGLSYHIMQNLPHIMRTLTGLADED